MLNYSFKSLWIFDLKIVFFKSDFEFILILKLKCWWFYVLLINDITEQWFSVYFVPEFWNGFRYIKANILSYGIPIASNAFRNNLPGIWNRNEIKQEHHSFLFTQCKTSHDWITDEQLVFLFFLNG